ncbi:hypothetical protein ACIF80_12395 [Streptomyces sp. NPDC085927]
MMVARAAVNSILTDAHPMIEVFPLDQARGTYERLTAAKTHFRALPKVSE